MRLSEKQRNEPPVKLTRAEKREIQAIIRKYKGDGKAHSAQASIPYQAMYPDGVCRVTANTFSKCIEFADISYQLAQADTKTAIFENLCDLYNYLDASIHVQFSFVNRKTDPKQYAKSFEIKAQGDDFDDIRAEYSGILQGKQLLPTKDGHNLVCVLPEVLTSPQLTAEWETKLTAIAKGEADPEGFMVGIEEMTRNLISRYSQISEDAQKLFQTERVVIGKCPRCGEAVYEGKKNYYCGNRACQFVMWKNDRFFEERGKTFTPKIAAALLKDGKAKVKGLRSMKTGKTYDGTVLLADTGGKYVNYRVEKKS